MENLPSEAPARLNSLPEKDGKDVVNKLFGMLKLQYPNFMNDLPENETKRVWFAHLKAYRQDHVEQAAILAPDRFPRFPPTIGEFKELLREINKPEPGKAIGMDDICPNCRSHRRSQIHAEQCK